MSKIFAVIGGDARQRYVADELERTGNVVERYAVPGRSDTRATLAEVVRRATHIILPMPAFREDGRIKNEENQLIELEEIENAVHDGVCLFLGKKPATLGKLESRVQVYDYAQWDALATENAVATAEGAIQLAMEQMTKTIHASRFLVIGAGRIGLCLARLLAALHGEVTVCARKSADMAKIANEGLTADLTGIYRLGLSQYDCIFNTVPATVLDAAQLETLQKNCVYIELASAPGGVGREECRLIGTRWIGGGGLPGRVAPETAGKVICKHILQFLQESGKEPRDE